MWTGELKFLKPILPDDQSIQFEDEFMGWEEAEWAAEEPVAELENALQKNQLCFPLKTWNLPSFQFLKKLFIWSKTSIKNTSSS